MIIAHGTALRLRLFLEGVEVPCISANVDSSPNSPGTASIQIPPLVEGTRFLPRTLVHLYFLDFAEASAMYVTDTGANAEKPGEENPSLLDKSLQQAEEADIEGKGNIDAAYGNFETDRKNSHYKLLFVGEIVGFQWTKAPMQRSLILQCMDLSNYWDYAYQFSNTGIFGPGLKAIFSGGATNLFTDFLSSKGSILTNIVVSGRCNSFPKLKGLAAGIVRLVEAIGGVYFPKPGSKSKRIAGQNLFFSIAELRLHLTQMVTAYEDDPTSSRICSRQGYSGMFDRALGGQGEQTSIRAAMNAMTQIVFHETYPQPCPYYIPGTEGEVSGTKRVEVKGHKDWDFISTAAEKGVKTLQEVKEEINSVDLEGEEIKYSSKDPTSVPNRLHALRKELNALIPEIWKKRVPDPAKSIYSQTSYAVGVASVRARNLRPGASAQRRKMVTDFIDKAIVQLKRAVNLTVLDKASKDISPARLVQQILRPDIWFGAPPRCNVIFPDRFLQVQYGRMFLQEPTRLLLKTNDEFFGEDAFFDKYYFAPQAGSTKKDNARLSDISRGDVLDHELFTGILPVFEKMGEFNVFAAKWAGASAQKSDDQLSAIKKVSFAQRSANFLYFKHRFNARQARVTGTFNPYVACGFPGLVIDKWVDENALRRSEEKLQEECGGQFGIPLGALSGTNFLGNFTQVSHSVQQMPGGMGTTSVILSYPRQPDESIEFLGAVDSVKKVQRREDVDAVRSTDVAALTPPKVHSLGPNSGRIINVEDVTSKYVQKSGAEGRKLPLFSPGMEQSSRKGSEEVSVGVPTTGSAEGSKVLGKLAGSMTKEVVLKALTITEEIPRYRQDEVLVPAEELIRPGWYGDIWSPSQIGQVYTDFFGIGAITDPQTILAPGGAATASVSEEAREALAEQQKAEDEDDPRKYAPSIIALDEGSSIQEAVEFLLLTYSHIKNAGMDVEEFIRAYTWRPIASMLDMFGTYDLQFSEDGEKVLDGIEGFHSRAFGEYENLFALTTPEIETIIGIKRGEPAAQRADTRMRKIRAVQAYRSALLFTRAILG